MTAAGSRAAARRGITPGVGISAASRVSACVCGRAGGYDKLAIGGKATLDGTLALKALDGFDANGTDVYTIMTFGSRVGTFSTVSGADIRNPALTVDAGLAQLDLK